MGARGPKAKPFEAKVLEGNRGRRPLEVNGQWRPMVEVPDPPKYLGKEARKEWKRITVELAANNLIAKLDQHMLGMLCQAVERVSLFETAISRRMAKLVEDGHDPERAYMMTTATGYEALNGLYVALNKERDVLAKLLGEFGLSPSMRSRVSLGQRGAQLALFSGGAGATPADDQPKEPAVPKSFSDFA